MPAQMATYTDELVLRTVVFQFDGRVLEVFGQAAGEAIRFHMALMKKEPQLDKPNRKGQSWLNIGSQCHLIEADELPELLAFLGRVNEARAYYRERTRPA
jgi:hypothetical protein